MTNRQSAHRLAQASANIHYYLSLSSTVQQWQTNTSFGAFDVPLCSLLSLHTVMKLNVLLTHVVFLQTRFQY